MDGIAFVRCVPPLLPISTSAKAAGYRSIGYFYFIPPHFAFPQDVLIMSPQKPYTCYLPRCTMHGSAAICYAKTTSTVDKRMLPRSYLWCVDVLHFLCLSKPVVSEWWPGDKVSSGRLFQPPNVPSSGTLDLLAIGES